MPIRKRPTTDQLYWRFQYKGRTYEKSMETASRREATERGQAWEVATKAAEATPALVPNLAVLRDLDIARARENRRSDLYIRDGLMSYWKHLVDFFPDVRACEGQGLKDYVKHRRAQGIRGQTISKELTCLKRGFREAEIRGPEFWPKLASDDPNEKMQSKKHSLEVWRAWLGKLKGEAHDQALFALLTGLRWGELYRVQPDDLSLDEGYVVLQVHEKVKRKKQRKIVLGPLAQTLTWRLPFEQTNHRRSRVTASRDNPAGNITLRDCRAAFATAGDRAGDQRATNMFMGHSGVPARYQKSDYARLYAVALAVETWLTGTAAGSQVTPDKVDTPPST